ncbi:hypothetical protein G5B37_00755 [Rasiella rasia]|uniref:Letm1 RBD domain-containing protein n=1 Tax=Rasiella rasia TaxID=2744027 RepID=A0A6G6GHZ5_9FLAO|nr:LETM1-related biofilm-associated protein [Rasiella rasia]QIE58144.1 hypothetical protein G5B37_00755 [Rasiella rasia]
MNPSASGWIPKYFKIRADAVSSESHIHESISYHQLQSAGFIHGVSITSLLQPIPTKIILTTDELTKINLFHLLVTRYFEHNNDATQKDAIKSILEFYHLIEKGRKGFFNQFARYSKNHTKLERIMAVRIHESNNLLKRNFTSLLTYAFLYLDVLAYEQYLLGKQDVKAFITRFESTVLYACFHALQSKQKKNKYDRLLIELFEGNAAYANSKKSQQEFVESVKASSPHQRTFILDISCLAVWDDFSMDASEAKFLRGLCEQLELSESTLATSIETIVILTQNESVQVKLFEYAHPVNQFYKQATKTVKTLIVRNKTRLITELHESGELIVLLGKSTSKELSAEEKAKVKSQLLDICKTIPSLTIFLLPGGTLLLPLLIKFIPQLLPSAFDENRIEK